MKTEGNTVLITGGATGIGFSLAEAFAKAGNDVIICGRRESKLRKAKEKLPNIYTKVCDLSKPEERKFLFEWATSNFKDFNVLVNNAGIQRMVDLKKGVAELLSGEDEIDINFKTCVHLSAYFIPTLMKQSEAAIINISSGLGFVPLAIMPVYCATKAAIHSFSLSLRHQLRNTPIKVFEIIPPTVDTELDRGARAARSQEERGIKPSEVAKAAIDAVGKDQYEVAIGEASNLVTNMKGNADQIFSRMNRW